MKISCGVNSWCKCGVNVEVTNSNNTDEDTKTHQPTTKHYDIVMLEGDDIISVSHTYIVNRQ